MKKTLLNIALTLGSPLTFLSALWLKFVMKAGGFKHGLSDNIFMGLGVLPLTDYYYYPMINPRKHLKKSLRDDRDLPGIKMNTDEQLALLSKFRYNAELLALPFEKVNSETYYYNNGFYEAGDAEYLYSLIRHVKPKRMIEIGSGNSTLMARNAVNKNKQEDATYDCKHTCIEPFYFGWIEKLGVELKQMLVEDVDKAIFRTLEAGDILFIDSSHVIRPQGDVLVEFLEILPMLKPGVFVHVHDIFTPKDYLNEWVYGHLMWNEQYLLEAFLSHNADFRIMGALNYLQHNHKKEVEAAFPILAKQSHKESKSFWFVRN
jgi:predicted O-methyltransferase YrrM